MTNLRFRSGEPADFYWASRVMAASDPWKTLGRTEADCLTALQDPRCDVIVADDLGRPAGFAVVDPRGLAGSPYLRLIAVAQACRSRGVGTALLRHVEARFGEPAGNLFLCVSSFNPRARALYEREGFAYVGELSDYLVAGEAEIIMRKVFRRPTRRRLPTLDAERKDQG